MATAIEPAATNEYDSVLPIPAGDRYAGTWTMIWLWAGGNILLTTFVLGGYYAPGIGATGLIVATIVGAGLGNLLPAISGLRSARYGVDEFIGIRSAFGTRGANIGVLMLVLVNFGWIGIFSALAGSSGSASLGQFGHGLSFPHAYTVFALGVGLVLPVVLLYVRHTAVFTLVKFAVPLLVIFAALLLWKQFSVFGWHDIARYKANHSVNWQYAIEAQIAYGVSWFPYMGAWNRFAKSERGSFVGVWVGMGVIAILFALVGGFATLTTGSSDPSVWATRSGLGVPALAIIVFSTLINSAMLLYCSAMAVRSALPKLPYHFVVVIVALPSIAFIYQGTLNSKFSILLTIAGGFIAPYWGVAMGDYFLLRRQRLDLVELYRGPGSRYWYRGGWNLIAVGVWIIGLVAWMFLGGWQSPYSWLAFPPGEHLFNALTATAPVVVGTALLYAGLIKLVIRRGKGTAAHGQLAPIGAAYEEAKPAPVAS
jgi:nucleobase:cation symporter-1, NCS1 family